LDKIDYNEVANKYFKEAQMGNKEGIFKKVFGDGYGMIEKFNQRAKDLEKEAGSVGDIANNLNKKNKGDDKSKREFEEVSSKFNEINNLFRDVAQGTGFYTKLNEILARVYSDEEGFIAARTM